MLPCGSDPPPSMPAGSRNAAPKQLSMPVPRLRHGTLPAGLMQHLPATLQGWAALAMPSGDATSFARRAIISDSFSSVGEYQLQMAASIREELHLRCE